MVPSAQYYMCALPEPEIALPQRSSDRRRKARKARQRPCFLHNSPSNSTHPPFHNHQIAHCAAQYAHNAHLHDTTINQCIIPKKRTFISTPCLIYILVMILPINTMQKSSGGCQTIYTRIGALEWLGCFAARHLARGTCSASILPIHRSLKLILMPPKYKQQSACMGGQLIEKLCNNKQAIPWWRFYKIIRGASNNRL